MNETSIGSLLDDDKKAALKAVHRAYVLEVGTIGLSGTGAELLNDNKVRAAYLGG